MQTTFVGSSNTCPRGWDFNSYDKHFIDNLADYMPYPQPFLLLSLPFTQTPLRELNNKAVLERKIKKYASMVSYVFLQEIHSSVFVRNRSHFAGYERLNLFFTAL